MTDPVAAGTDRLVALPNPVFDIDALLGDRSTDIIVCCGSGGVGKTTTAAAMAVRAAEAGRSVAVLTIDPAKRLAQSLGLTELDNTPRPVESVDTSAGGSLDAMMLDMKRTFDEIVEAHATPEKAETIFANPFYEALSSSFAGTQEYMAMEKLGQLHLVGRDAGRPRWDLIVVDTPPSRSALDFLDAPARLSSFLDGRLVRVLTTPARASGRMYSRMMSAGLSLAGGALAKVLGRQLLDDVQLFVSAMDTTFGGFRERADHTYALLKAPGTAFVVVAAPTDDSLREAGYFVDRLAADRMPLAGAVVNRLERSAAPGLTDGLPERFADETHTGGAADCAPVASPLTLDLLRLQAEMAAVAGRQEQLVADFGRLHREIPAVVVPTEDTDIHDLEGLRTIGHLLNRKHGRN